MIDVLLRSYWIAAIVTYARCFKTGVRSGLETREVLLGREEWTPAHELFMALRDKHIAHSVSPYEDNITGLALTLPSSSERRIENVVTANMAHDTPNIEQVLYFTALIREVVKYVKAEQAVAHARLKEAISALSLDELYALEPLILQGIVSGDHRRTRKRID